MEMQSPLSLVASSFKFLVLLYGKYKREQYIMSIVK